MPKKDFFEKKFVEKINIFSFFADFQIEKSHHKNSVFQMPVSVLFAAAKFYLKKPKLNFLFTYYVNKDIFSD